jgi:hypothetical protein
LVASWAKSVSADTSVPPRFFAPEKFFKGGAGGSHATGRKRQERVLLQGLKDLLANLDTGGSDSENDQGISPASSPRGRPAPRLSPETTRRDESPGWQEVKKKARMGRVRDPLRIN